MAECNLSAERVRELFEYDPVTGILTRKPSRYSGWRSVPITQSHHPRGYLKTAVDGRNYFVHRLIWLMAYGAWPEQDIDHINRDPSDNRLENLRDVSRKVNNNNRRARPRTTPLPVSKGGTRKPHGAGSVYFVRSVKSKPYRARLVVADKNFNLGYFATPEEAWAAIAAHKQSTGQLPSTL
jgi:hypothetical protein